MGERIVDNVLITGASSGIGAALARAYARPGRLLALNGRDRERLDAAAAACRERGAEVMTSTVDVRARDAMRDWIDALDARRPLDLVVANAGVALGTTGTDEPTDADAVIRATNIDGVVHTAAPALRHFGARGRGQLALVGSLAGFRPLPGAPAYSASKAWVMAYGLALRGQWAGRGVGVSVICPGFVESRITATNRFAMPGFMDADRAAAIIRRGLARDRAIIAFPRRTAWPTRVIGLLPSSVTDPLFRALPRKE